MRGGLCECGCGKKTPIATRTDRTRGAVKGQPRRFLPNHRIAALNRERSGEQHWKWNGGRSTDGSYVLVFRPDHPRANARGYVREHILVVEKAIGRYLPAGHPVHHFNEVRSDNRPENLVVCEDDAYHNLLHQRQRSMEACGNPDWRKCQYCKEYDAPENLDFNPSNGMAHHPDRACAAGKGGAR